MTGQQLLTETDIFIDSLKLWKRLLVPNRTWTRFKTNFSLASQELRENTAVVQRIVGQVNNVCNDLEIAEAMEIFATAAVADRTTLVALSATIE